MIKLNQGESTTLDLKPDEPAAARWDSHPAGLVSLAPAGDGRSCVATAEVVVDAKPTMGRVTVKAVSAERIGVGYFSLAISPAAKPTPPEPEPAPVESVVPE